MLDRNKYNLLRSELLQTRLSCGLRQIDLAKSLDKPQSYVSKVESGERSLDVIEFVNYCQALNVNPSKFLAVLLENRF